MMKSALLPDRTVIALTGLDRESFLQGLVSNDVAQVTPGRAVWAALLTPQGKWLADFFILQDQDRLLLDCEREQASMLIEKLRRFRLRAQVELQRTEHVVQVAWGGAPEAAPGRIVAADPRLPDAGWRVLGGDAAGPVAGAEDAAEWDRHRLLLGLPDGSRDCESGKTVLLEAGFDELGGISWSKGCYMGQELTARTRYRGLLKRRLVPVASEMTLPAPGTPILHQGIEVGTMRSSRDDLGLAVLRLEHIHSRLEALGQHLTTRVPDWMRLPQAQPVA